MTPLSLPEKAKLIGRILSDKGKTLSKVLNSFLIFFF